MNFCLTRCIDYCIQRVYGLDLPLVEFESPQPPIVIPTKAEYPMHEEFPSNQPDTISRRLFTQKFLSVAAMGVLPSTAVNAKSAPAIGVTGKPNGFSDQDWDELQERYKNLLRVYASRLSPSERHHVLQVLITNQYMLKSIRSFVVQNGDASATTLRLVT
jgi:hypothetical protein